MIDHQRAQKDHWAGALCRYLAAKVALRHRAVLQGRHPIIPALATPPIPPEMPPNPTPPLESPPVIDDPPGVPPPAPVHDPPSMPPSPNAAVKQPRHR